MLGRKPGRPRKDRKTQMVTVLYEIYTQAEAVRKSKLEAGEKITQIDWFSLVLKSGLESIELGKS